MIVTDTTSQESFDGIDMWLREVSKHGGEKMPVVIIGTKSDLKTPTSEYPNQKTRVKGNNIYF